MATRKILLAVDLQKDFIDGSFTVPGAYSVLPEINSVKGAFDLVYFTLDWHPLNHCSFQEQGGPWPVHCVHHTAGASIPDEMFAGLEESQTLIFAPQAIEDLSKLKKSEPAAFKKAGKLLAELQEHPRTGTGKPEPLSGERAGQWSRRISQKHRLVYEIEEIIVKVDVLSAYGHYEDKLVDR